MALALLAGCFMLLPSKAQNGEPQLKIFLKNGTVLQYDGDEVDSLTVSGQEQLLWHDGQAQATALSDIDSVIVSEEILVLSSHAVNYNDVVLGTADRRMLYLDNCSDEPVTVSVKRITGDFVCAQAGQTLTIAPGESEGIEVKFKPASTGEKAGVITFESDALWPRTLDVPLTGYGIEEDDVLDIVNDNVVATDPDDVTTLSSDAEAGNYVVEYANGVPSDLKAGSVVVLEEDGHYNVVLVTDAQVSGNRAEIKGQKGDISHIFHDVAFTYNSATNEVIVDSLPGQAVHRSISRVRRAANTGYKDKFNIFSLTKGFSKNLVESGDSKLAVNGSVNANLDCEVHFEFFDKVNDVFDGYYFAKAEQFKMGFKLIGELTFKAGVSLDIAKKYTAYLDNAKKPLIMREDFFKPKTIKFSVYGVPVTIILGCDLLNYGWITFDGQGHVEKETSLTFRGEWGQDYDPSNLLGQVYKEIKNADVTYTNPPAKVSGKVDVEAKVYPVIPRFFARVYDIVGPCIDLRPYFDWNMGGSFRENVDGTGNWDDKDANGTPYMANYFNMSFGLDWGLGLSYGYWERLEDDVWDCGKFFFDPVNFVESPSGLKLIEESTKRVRAHEAIDYRFEGLYKLLGRESKSPLFPIIKIDIPQRQYHTYLFTTPLRDGVSYRWLPESDDEEMFAQVYGRDGKLIASMQFPKKEEDTMSAITDDVTDAHHTTATLCGMFDPGQNVAIKEMGFCLSAKQQVPKLDNGAEVIKLPCADELQQGTTVLTDLQPNTTYYYRSYATNRYRTTYGSVKSFTTGEAELPAGEHEYVDLGLSVMWATCNVGASRPEDYGDYYAWGETETKDVYDESTYWWCNGSYRTLTKYCNDSYYGEIDNKTILEPKDDVVQVKWRDFWRMPTMSELSELREKCIWTWDDTREGFKVTGPNGKSIFMPAAGVMRDGSQVAVGSIGSYMSSMNQTEDPHYMLTLNFTSSRVFDFQQFRWEGRTVRPVYDAGGSQPFLTLSVYDYSVGASGGEVPIKYESNVSCTCRAKEDWITFSSSNPTVMIVAPNPTSAPRTNKVVIENEEYGLKETITVVQDAGEAPSGEHEYVDLGLSVKWATCNVGASTPEDYGDYYAWGETETKEVYYWKTYLDSPNRDDRSFTKYYNDGGMTKLDPEDDVAHVKWKGNWRMPTCAELEELIEKCTWTWNDSKKGYEVTGPSGNSIFLPAAGYRYDSDLYGSGYYGYYWSSSLDPGVDRVAYYLYFDSGDWCWSYHYRYGGLSVRAVCP